MHGKVLCLLKHLPARAGLNVLTVVWLMWRKLSGNSRPRDPAFCSERWVGQVEEIGWLEVGQRIKSEDRFGIVSGGRRWDSS